jgi:hypothetical protein
MHLRYVAETIKNTMHYVILKCQVQGKMSQAMLYFSTLMLATLYFPSHIGSFVLRTR